MNKKVSLLLLGKKGFVVLLSILDSYKDLIDTIVVARDTGVDNDYYQEIKDICFQNSINCINKDKANSYLNTFSGYIFAIGWRWMVPPNNNLIVIHDSLLPKYRGFAPLVNALINGETEIGVTALHGTEEYDTGPIISRKSIEISYPIKISTAIDKISELYIVVVNDTLNTISSGKQLDSIPQNNFEATYSLWRDEKDYFLDWTRSAKEIERFVDAVGEPYLGARCYVDGVLAIVRSAESVSDLYVCDRNNAIGKVINIVNGKPVVVCQKGLLKITEMYSESGESLLPLKKFRVRFTP